MNETTAATEELRRALAAEEGGRRWLRRLAVAGSIVLVLGGGLTWRAKHRPLPPPKYVTKAVDTGDIVEKVQATGAVQPLLQVNVGAQVNGRVTRVPVDFNSIVKKGDVLAEIDPKIYGTQVYAQESNLLQQRAGLETAKAQMETSRAQMNLAKVTLDRTQRLFDDSLASKGDLDTARGQWLASKATYDAAVASVTGAQAGIGSQEAQLSQMTTNLGYTKIYSPVDGVVVTRSIDPGATVVSSFQAPVLFVIAQELKKMRVMADVDEADVGRLKEGMAADAVVDAFPGESFHGIVQQVRYSPNNVSGVVTYSAVVEVENPDEKLRPGMTATVTIKTSETKGATKIPNAALRYKPTPPDGPDGKPIVPPPDPPLSKGQGRVHVLIADKPGEEKEEMRVIPIGITDGMATEVLNGALPLATKVVTDETDTKKKGGMF
jgi:HlyD family secretion protein